MKEKGIKKVFITGASRHFGLLLAQHYIKEGWLVFAHYRQINDNLVTLEKQGAILLQADLTVEIEVNSLNQSLLDQADYLDLIIHNASLFSQDNKDKTQVTQQFYDFFSVHMLAPLLINHACISLLKASPRTLTDIIHITDIYADNPKVNYSLYCSSKAGLQNLSQSFAKQYAPHTKVNIIQPGPITFQAFHKESEKEVILNRTLLEKTGGYSSLLQAVQSIVSNDFMTGSIIKIDGGRSIT